MINNILMSVLSHRRGWVKCLCILCRHSQRAGMPYLSFSIISCLLRSLSSLSLSLLLSSSSYSAFLSFSRCLCLSSLSFASLLAFSLLSVSLFSRSAAILACLNALISIAAHSGRLGPQGHQWIWMLRDECLGYDAYLCQDCTREKHAVLSKCVQKPFRKFALLLVTDLPGIDGIALYTEWDKVSVMWGYAWAFQMKLLKGRMNGFHRKRMSSWIVQAWNPRRQSGMKSMQRLL